MKTKLFFAFFLAFIASYGFSKEAALQTVSYVDLSRYMGTWYEIARYENRFQKKCYATKTQYALTEEGKVLVTNTCTLKKDPSESSTAEGIAFVENKKTNAELKVGFAPLFKYLGWFTGDYWILKLGENYEYAMIGTPNFKYFWIIARSPQISDELYAELIKYAVDQGFEEQKIQKSPTWSF